MIFLELFQALRGIPPFQVESDALHDCIVRVPTLGAPSYDVDEARDVSPEGWMRTSTGRMKCAGAPSDRQAPHGRRSVPRAIGQFIVAAGPVFVAAWLAAAAPAIAQEPEAAPSPAPAQDAPAEETPPAKPKPRPKPKAAPKPKPAEDTKPAEAKPSETKPSETKPSEEKPPVDRAILEPDEPGAAAVWPNGARTVSESYGDWTMNCNKDAARTDCVVIQSQGDRRTGKRQFSFELRVPKDGRAEGLILMPFGLQIEPGVTFKLDDRGLGKGAPYSYCVTDGCLVPISLPSLATDAMKTAQSLTVSAMKPDAKEPTLITVPMSGFAAAFARAIALGG